MPHFYALAWMYKNDYKSAGFKMLSIRGVQGDMVANRSLFYCILLIISSVLPFYFQKASILYLSIVILLNFYIGIKAYAFLNEENKDENAMKLFKASIAYLPLLLILLLFDSFFIYKLSYMFI